MKAFHPPLITFPLAVFLKNLRWVITASAGGLFLMVISGIVKPAPKCFLFGRVISLLHVYRYKFDYGIANPPNLSFSFFHSLNHIANSCIRIEINDGGVVVFFSSFVSFFLLRCPYCSSPNRSEAHTGHANQKSVLVTLTSTRRDNTKHASPFVSLYLAVEREHWT